MEQTNESENRDEAGAGLSGGAYEIIRNRLLARGKELRARMNRLNEARKEIFGSVETTLLATERISTAHNCEPRDMITVNGDSFLFGYNVRMGLKSETALEDVFAVYEYKDHRFRELPADVLRSGRFDRDFKDLYKYYKRARFAKFAVLGPHLFMVFRTGKAVTDIKTFKWLIRDDGVEYVDNRSDHEFRYPPQHEFEWIRTTRDQHRRGEHPHISIEDRLFVEAVGGDITFKVEDNTASGLGIYAEPVEDKDQTLDDAEIHYSVLGHMILVRIRPYREETIRYFIYNEKTEEVHRVDEIEHACVLLPDDHGLIFSNGYYLQTGELKRYETRLSDMLFERRLASANGEDYLYIFYNRESGDYVLMSYNIIEQAVDAPIICNGFTLFDSGEMIYFRAEEEPSRHHVVQIWQTPYSREVAAPAGRDDSYLFKVGNADIVRCMSEVNELLKLMNREDSYQGLYLDILRIAGEAADSYFWLDREEAFNLKEVILEIKDAAGSAIGEFEKVARIKKSALDEVNRVAAKTREILSASAAERADGIDVFVKTLAGLRAVRGEIISLKELRYVDAARVEKLEKDVAERTEKASAGCVTFLLTPESLTPYEKRVAELSERIDGLSKVSDADRTRDAVEGAAGELEMLIEIVSNLKIDDSTHATRIIDNISDIYSVLNGVRAALKNKRKSLLSVEGVAQFNAQTKLLNQSAVNYLDISDTPEKCDDHLTRIMVQIEELEGRFVDFDEFIVQLSEKREELYAAFEARKLALVEKRNKRANALMSAAERILAGVRNRVSVMDDVNDINGYFASDLMIDKIRDIVRQLGELDDTVKADDIQSRMKTIREESVRRLKDRKELYEGDGSVIVFGEHRFSVNRQPLDLTIVMRDGEQVFHLAGTNFFETITDEEFLRTRPVWDMETPSENDEVYRGEYLAYQLLKDAEARGRAFFDEFPGIGGGAPLEEPEEKVGEEIGKKQLKYVQRFMGPRYAEGYAKGVHDRDALKIFRRLAAMHPAIGLLRFTPRVRALGNLFWMLYPDNENRELLGAKIRAFGVMKELFSGESVQESYVAQLSRLIHDFASETGLFPEGDAAPAAACLFLQLSEGEGFVISREAFELASGFDAHVSSRRFAEKFKATREKIETDPPGEYELIRDWVGAYAGMKAPLELPGYIDEAAVLVLERKRKSMLEHKNRVLDVETHADISGMTGAHKNVETGVYHLNYNLFMDRLDQFEKEVVPLFNTCHDIKRSLVEEAREEMKLHEFKPRVLSSFVRNRLINQVYLPLVGDNLAKQIGVAGEGKRTDLMGLLLLVSPPGYGKTTLMEYLASRLGVIFMKINGPAIGHLVTSLDPSEAPNAGAREELKKLNLSFEMGDNVMIYLDDIQHLNPELLQKFISLCDAQRKIEGVYKGKSKTYDLRGRKVVVVMAGNPYTESGEKFKIPDMLANRADTYNLGDIIGDNEDAFRMSHLENALTSNSVLNKLYTRSREDVYAVIRIAETGSRDGLEFKGSYSAEEIDEMVSVMEKMMTARDVVLRVNREYIHSAAQADEFRTEPPFKLQGSYRNMNRLAEKIVPIMNDQELDGLVLSHYVNEAQTLTTGTEANLLKFKEIIGWMNEEEEERWREIKRTFKKNQLFRGADEADPLNRVLVALTTFYEGLDSIKAVLESGVARMGKRKGRDREAPETRVVFSEETMNGVRDLIGAMKGALAESMDQRAGGASETSVSLSAETMKRIDRQIGAIRGALAKAVQAGARPSGPPIPERMEVVAEVPDSIRMVLEKQFEVMDAWMQPALEETARQTKAIEKLMREMDALKTSYKGVIREKGNFDEAIVYYTTALEKNPRDAEAYYNRAVAWYSKKDVTRALSDAANALEIDGKNKRYQQFVAYLKAEDAAG